MKWPFSCLQDSHYHPTEQITVNPKTSDRLWPSHQPLVLQLRQRLWLQHVLVPLPVWSGSGCCVSFRCASSEAAAWRLSHVLVQLQRTLLQVRFNTFDLGWCRAVLCVRGSQPGVYPQSRGRGFCQVPGQELWPRWRTHLDRTQWHPQRWKMDVVWWLCSGLCLLECRRAKQLRRKWTLCSQQPWHRSEVEWLSVFRNLSLCLCISHNVSFLTDVVPYVWFNLGPVHLFLCWCATTKITVYNECVCVHLDWTLRWSVTFHLLLCSDDRFKCDDWNSPFVFCVLDPSWSLKLVLPSYLCVSWVWVISWKTLKGPICKKTLTPWDGDRPDLQSQRGSIWGAGNETQKSTFMETGNRYFILELHISLLSVVLFYFTTSIW